MQHFAYSNDNCHFNDSFQASLLSGIQLSLLHRDHFHLVSVLPSYKPRSVLPSHVKAKKKKKKKPNTGLQWRQKGRMRCSERVS